MPSPLQARAKELNTAYYRAYFAGRSIEHVAHTMRIFNEMQLVRSGGLG